MEFELIKCNHCQKSTRISIRRGRCGRIVLCCVLDLQTDEINMPKLMQFNLIRILLFDVRVCVPFDGSLLCVNEHQTLIACAGIMCRMFLTISRLICEYLFIHLTSKYDMQTGYDSNRWQFTALPD